MVMRVFSACIGVGFVLAAQLSDAAVYQWTDKQGQKHYSDSRELGARVYDLVASYSYHEVRRVYDGDTVQLVDGRKIRLSGINTPEVEHSNAIAQAGGEAAKKWLSQVLTGKKVRLEFDQEKQDKYKRYLAHLFTEQGMHLNRELVRLGFASVNTFPPNLKYVPELLVAEQQAEINQLGIWAYPDYLPKSATQLTKSNKQGWQRIYGRVTGIKKARKNVYLTLPDDFEVGIKKAHLAYFDDLDSLKGKNIEVRGWVNRHKKGFLMWLKHSSAIKRR